LNLACNAEVPLCYRNCTRLEGPRKGKPRAASLRKNNVLARALGPYAAKSMSCLQFKQKALLLLFYIQPGFIRNEIIVCGYKDTSHYRNRGQIVCFAYATSSWVKRKETLHTLKPKSIPTQEMWQRTTKELPLGNNILVWTAMPVYLQTPRIPLPILLTDLQRKDSPRL
jgi:hypothetical protein